MERGARRRYHMLIELRRYREAEHLARCMLAQDPGSALGHSFFSGWRPGVVFLFVSGCFYARRAVEGASARRR